MRYLGLDWIEAMKAHVADSESMRTAAETCSIGVTQVVTDGPEGTVVYHLQVGDGVAAFGPGPAPQEDVRFEQSWATAVGVATGTIPAQTVFVNGQVRLSGDTQKVVENVAVFAALDSAFAAVRDITTYE